VQDNTIPSSQLWLDRSNLYSKEESQVRLRSRRKSTKGFIGKMSQLETLSSLQKTCVL